MEQEKTETFIFRGEEVKVTPEVKKCCEQLAQDIAELEEVIAKYGDCELSPEQSRELQRITEWVVAQAGINCAMAEFLKVRA